MKVWRLGVAVGMDSFHTSALLHMFTQIRPAIGVRPPHGVQAGCQADFGSIGQHEWSDTRAAHEQSRLASDFCEHCIYSGNHEGWWTFLRAHVYAMTSWMVLVHFTAVAILARYAHVQFFCVCVIDDIDWGSKPLPWCPCVERLWFFILVCVA